MTEIEYSPKNKLLLIGMLIFTIGTFTLDTFVSSSKIKVLFLTLTIFVFITYYIVYKKKIVIYKIELLWLVFFMYFLFNVLYQSNLPEMFYSDIVVFFVLFLFLLLVKIDISYYKVAMSTMAVIAIIYAFSSFFQYLNMDLYSKLILPRFSLSKQEEIIRIYNHGSYTGFTWQTAYISGYLIFGIGSVLLLFKQKTSKFSRILSIVALVLMFIALMLGGKRAHMLFMVLALIFTFLFSIELKRFFTHFFKLIFGIVLSLISTIAFFSVYTPDKETPIGRFYNQINITIEGLIAGEDITSGRSLLYDYAFKLFNDTPIFGIGWREFRELSGGILSSNRGSHPHNIYLQLLTELGIVGFILFMIPITYIFIKTIKLLMNAESLFNFDMRWKTALQFSLYIQTFFLLYGITGNLLTDHMYMLMWGFAASITLSSMKYAKRRLSGQIKKVSL